MKTVPQHKISLGLKDKITLLDGREFLVWSSDRITGNIVSCGTGERMLGEYLVQSVEFTDGSKILVDNN